MYSRLLLKLINIKVKFWIKLSFYCGYEYNISIEENNAILNYGRMSNKYK